MTRAYEQDELEHIVCQTAQMIAPVPPESVKLSDRLVGDLGFHSLAMVELAYALEDVFSLEEVGSGIVNRIERIGDIIPLVRTALQNGAAKMPSPDDLAQLAAEYGFVWEKKNGPLPTDR
jgi:acyl carrier protein